MKLTIIEEDLNKAIKEREISMASISCSCLITQTFIRECTNNKIPFKKISTCPISYRTGICFTLDGTYAENKGGAYIILCAELENLMNEFDLQQYSRINSKLPFSFEFNFPSGVENANSSNNTKS